MSRKTVYLKGHGLAIADIINIAEKPGEYAVAFDDATRNNIEKGRRALEKQLDEHPEIPIYGTNVLHGDLKDISIDSKTMYDYQVKYIKVHNCGTGHRLPVAIVRAMMVIRLNSFAKGLSGMQIETCDMLLEMINRNVVPEVLEEGSVGASGDLVPLAMIGAAMIELEEATAYYGDEWMPAKQAMHVSGIKEEFKRKYNKEFKLGAKEAMGLTNGANFIAAISVLHCEMLSKYLRTASISTALSLEAIRGEKRAFSE